MFRLLSIKHTTFFALLFVLGYATQAQEFSYIYIQGDKKTPFYVKFEDEMLPRYGKNYCIIPMLAPGPINIEILFQQSIYPSQKFTISVPESSNRSFLLRNNKGLFSLYDMQQQFTLPADNTIEQDHLPASTGLVYNTSNTPKQYTNTGSREQPKSTPTAYRQPEKTPVIKKPSSRHTPVKTNSDNKSPKFIANIQLNNGSNKKSAINTQKPVSKPEVRQPIKTTEAINTTEKITLHNSDCPTPIDDNTFDGIYDKANNKSDKVRLKYLLTEVDNCFSTLQAKTLALTLPNDPERYTFLKRIYPRVTDQTNFPVLENILSTTDWKDYFKLIIPQ